MLRCCRLYNGGNYSTCLLPSISFFHRSYTSDNNQFTSGYDRDYEWKSSFKQQQPTLGGLKRKKRSVLTGEERSTDKNANMDILNKFGLLHKGVISTSTSTNPSSNSTAPSTTSTSSDKQTADTSSEYSDLVEYHPSMTRKRVTNNISTNESIDASNGEDIAKITKPKRTRKTKKTEASTETTLGVDADVSTTSTTKVKRTRRKKKDEDAESKTNDKDGAITVESLEEPVINPKLLQSQAKKKAAGKKKSLAQVDADDVSSEFGHIGTGMVEHDINWLVDNQMTVIDAPPTLDPFIDDSANARRPTSTPRLPRTKRTPVVYDENMLKRYKDWVSYRAQLLESVPVHVDLPDLPQESFNVTTANAPQSPLNRPFPWDKFVEGCNRLVFQNDKLRLLQQEAINSVLYRRDTFISLPTGGGKSLCFQLPALIDSGVTLVVSPLLALMYDQVSKMQQLGIPVCSLNSSITVGEKRKIISDLLDPNGCPYKLLYVTPERLASPDFAKILEHLNKTSQLRRLVVDEAHCISEWGHDFRKDYRKLSNFRTTFPDIPITALTATATPRVETDIKAQLIMKNTVNVRASFVRSNLKYEVRRKSADFSVVSNDITSFIKRRHGQSAGIIYCSTTRECEMLADHLKDSGLSADFYHAGLNSTKRVNIQQRWLEGDFKIVCTTIAFGMGIDKSDTRFVIHHSVPSSIEAYYQQTGRAGRDGRLSDCLLYYHRNDVKRLLVIGSRSIMASTPDEYEKIAVSKAENLDTVSSYCVNSVCRRVSLMEYFGEKVKACRTHCDNCVAPKSKEHFRDKGVVDEDDDTDLNASIYTSRHSFASERKRPKRGSARFISNNEDEDEDDDGSEEVD
ncbi:hypothetical protein SAMD00019534_062030 [Acytostelium subglobosum LB1]|uniref:hypothetical protein n=1 Tax=Acytostelium subglobosum LB1 TaxID=1410327 RepID=UPI000644FDAB|nr:hypothetical protein SAMD00019534_062030 [Acytostelium subglobosum LB1]GAM23028.1 hypothetical protein SAMD00019534_062030 [Acytostelium subglobosum LB1]|eukprot:XP_012754255.1 hypothetical protein SAMD00019534_062030 [Acytostelium subglobosum LB1]